MNLQKIKIYKRNIIPIIIIKFGAEKLKNKYQKNKFLNGF